jgi:hypothetical protein
MQLIPNQSTRRSTVQLYFPPLVFLGITLSVFRNRVAVQLQKNLDRVRLRRLAHKLTGSRTGGFLGGLPGQLMENPRKKKEPTPGKLAW